MIRLKLTAASILARLGVFAAVAVARQEPAGAGASILKAMSGITHERTTDKDDQTKDAELAILKVEGEWRDAIVRGATSKPSTDSWPMITSPWIPAATSGISQTLAAHRSGEYSRNRTRQSRPRSESRETPPSLTA